MAKISNFFHSNFSSCFGFQIWEGFRRKLRNKRRKSRLKSRSKHSSVLKGRYMARVLRRAVLSCLRACILYGKLNINLSRSCNLFFYRSLDSNNYCAASNNNKYFSIQIFLSFSRHFYFFHVN